MLYESSYYGVAGLGDDSLQHHGIKGQKWGVRRFQNADGSLTPEGQKRYGANSMTSAERNKMIRSLHGDGRLNFDKLPDTEKKRSFLDAADKLARANKELEDSLDAFYGDHDTYVKYTTKSAAEAWKNTNEYNKTHISYKDWVDSYVNDDADQGAKTGLDYYFDDHPDKRQRYENAVGETRKAYRSINAARDAYVKELVYDQGKRTVQRYGTKLVNGQYKTVKVEEPLSRAVLTQLYDVEHDIEERINKSK